MPKSQLAGISGNQENLKISVQCACPLKQNYARRTDRPALANVQIEALHKQHSAADYGKKVTFLSTSKTLAAGSKIPIKPSPGSKAAARAESTKVEPSTSHVPPAIKLPPVTKTVTFLSTSKTLSAGSQIPIKPSPGSKATARAESTKVEPSTFHVPPAIKLSPVKKTVETKLALNSQHLLQPNFRSRRSNSCRYPNTKLSTTGLIKSEKEDTPSSHIGRHIDYQNKNDDIFLHPNSAKKRPTIRSSSQPRISLYSDEQAATDVHTTRKQSASESCASISENSSKLTRSNTGTKQPTNKKVNRHKSWSSIKSESNMYLCDRQVERCDKNQSKHTILKAGSSENLVLYNTMPDQRFVTLSQDTLEITRSQLDSVISKMNKVKFTRDTSFVSEEEKTFIHGEKFFCELDNGKSCTARTISVRSPCSINVPLRRSDRTSERDSIRKPAVKSTLKRRSSIKKETTFPLLYSPEYSEDLLSYCYKHRNAFLLRSEWIDMYVDKRTRTNVVNWLLKMSGFLVPQYEPVFYMAVRLFDHSIIRLKLRNTHYQLAAITALWISLKYLDITIVLKVSKIFSLCRGKYSKAEILHMERRILKSVDFCLNIADPLDFLYNYLRTLNLELELLEHGAKFILECATLYETYPLLDAPFLAANAVYMAYKKVSKACEVCLNFIWYDNKSIEHFNDRILRTNVKCVIMEKYEPLAKYLTPEKMYVAELFFDI